MMPAEPRREQPRSFVVGTAGHIDHGKTALVFALTGVDTDQLPEEKSRGITINLGFAALRFEEEAGHSLDISLIDVPGHHAFIRNMLAGTAGIDCVLLVIAADEGVKAQTIEHLAICSLLGISAGVVVLTKKDAVSAERLASLSEEVSRLLRHTFLEHARILPVSARTREGIAELKRELQQLALQRPERNNNAVPRLPIDRAFTMRGFGTVVTGTLQSGSLRTGDTLQLQPAGRMVRVRGVQVHGNAKAEAHGPCRVALNLAGMDVAEVSRGKTLTLADTLLPVKTLDAEVSMLPGAPKIKHRSRVFIHAFTSDTLATVLLYEPTPQGINDAPCSSMFVRIQLASPMLVVPGDRFVIRQCSPSATIGGGLVLDSHPLPGLKKGLTRRWLQELKCGSPTEQLLLRVSRRGLNGIIVRDLVAETGLTPDALRTLVEPPIQDGLLVATSTDNFIVNRLIGSKFLTDATELLMKLVESANLAAVPQAELRSRARLNNWVFDLALERLQLAQAIHIEGEFISLPSILDMQAVKSNRLAEVEQMYLAAGLAAPTVSEIACELGMAGPEMYSLVTMLIRTKDLVRLGADNRFIHRAALERLQAQLESYSGEHFDVPRFKALTCLTRKHAIPLLEYLDRARVTRNINGVRIVL